MTITNSNESDNQQSNVLKSIAQRPKESASDHHAAKFARNYLDSLEAHFKSLSSSFGLAGNHPAHANAESIIKKYENSHLAPSWSDLIQLDLSIIQLLTGYHLQLKIAELRQRVSAIPYAGRVEVLMPPEKLNENGNEDLLRAEAVQLATRLWQVRKARHEREGKLKALITSQTHVAVSILLFVFILVLIDRYGKNNGLSFLPVLFGFGVAGAFMSVLRRLQQAIGTDSDPDLSKEFSALENEGEKLWISLIMGGVFSILLYFLFSSGVGDSLLGNTLVPQFHCGGSSNCTPIQNDSFLTANLPKTATDFSKCIVWSFLAGFSEQLVPDVLSRLSKQKQ